MEQQDDSITETGKQFLIAMTLGQLFRVVIVGLIVGLLTWSLAQLLDMYLFKGMICQGSVSMRCDASLTYASALAVVLGGVVGSLTLAKLQVYRSLLVTIASTITLWGLPIITSDWSWQAALLATVGLFAVSYSMYAWIARIRSFPMAAIVTIVLVVVARFVLNL
jgi:hypothetical protein